MNENVIRIVSLGAVDDDSLEIFVPRLRMAEKFAKFTFAFDRIGSKACNKLFGNVFVNVVGIGMTEIIVESRPDVVAREFLKCIHGKPPENIKSPARETQS